MWKVDIEGVAFYKDDSLHGGEREYHERTIADCHLPI
jgi:hypothetical protein